MAIPSPLTLLCGLSASVACLDKSLLNASLKSVEEYVLESSPILGV